ncbi:MAG: hypothetical protein OXF20_10375 [Gammaproteobacteria bacterium]|nr:hypothetical protein [Gammaproteobacteria bacterium]
MTYHELPEDVTKRESDEIHTNMTKLDRFALVAMQAMVSSDKYLDLVFKKIEKESGRRSSLNDTYEIRKEMNDLKGNYK